MVKVAFFDVDGTLLSHKSKSVPENTRRALNLLQAKGIKCVVATGRHLTEMEKLPVDGLAFDGYITLNGQLCLDADKKMLCGTPISGEMAENLVALFQKNRFPILLIEEKSLYLNYVDDRVKQVQAMISSDIPRLGQYEGGTLYQAAIYIGDESMAELAAALPDCEITRWNAGGVDVIAKGGSKVTGLCHYLEENGIAREECIAFGDGENDMGMLQYAGIGVAMGNAEDCVKEVADYVTDGVDEDGILNALKHFGVIE